MTTMNNKSHSMPLVYKVICGVAVAICVIIGLIGLVLPIIPGFLFLFFAALLLTRISKRFANIMNDSPTLSRWRRQLHSTRGLSIQQRVKLSFWVVARGMVQTVESGLNYLRKK